jgi:hypothetical protein
MDLGIAVQDDGFEADVLADEAGEFVGRDFAQAFKARDFGVAAQLLERILLLGLE